MTEWLDGKKTYIASALGFLAVIAGTILGPDVGAQLDAGQEALASAGWADDIKWVAAFLSFIFLRFGVKKAEV